MDPLILAGSAETHPTASLILGVIVAGVVFGLVVGVIRALLK